MNEKTIRPWGFFENLLENEQYKVKKIAVYPHSRLSLQKHQYRAEHWYIVEGKGEITLDEAIIAVSPGSSIDIKQGARHRVANSGEVDLVFIEIQSGSYFGEDDIVRLEDDYGRT